MRATLSVFLCLCIVGAASAQSLVGNPKQQPPKMPESKDKRANAVAKQIQKDSKKNADPKTRAQMEALTKKITDQTFADKKTKGRSSDKASNAMESYRK